MSLGRTSARSRSAASHQQLVADVVAQAVVDRLEAVEVEEENRAGLLAALDPGQRQAQAIEEERSVGKVGQGVVRGLAGELELGALALDGVADGPPQQVAVGVALDQVVLGALLDGLERDVLVLLAAEHHDRYLWRAGAHGLQTLQARGVGEREIEQDAAQIFVHERRLGLGDRAPMVDHDRSTKLLLQEMPDEQGVLRTVLDQRDPDRASARTSRGWSGVGNAYERMIDAHRPCIRTRAPAS